MITSGSGEQLRGTRTVPPVFVAEGVMLALTRRPRCRGRLIGPEVIHELRAGPDRVGCTTCAPCPLIVTRA